MAFDFPASPTNGQEFTAGSRTWVWNGTTWDGKANNAVPEAPADTKYYARKDNAWADLAALLYARVTGTSHKIILQDPGDPTQKLMILADHVPSGGGSADRTVTFATAFKTGTLPIVIVTGLSGTPAYNMSSVSVTTVTATGFNMLRRIGGSSAGNAGVAGNATFNVLDIGIYYFAIGVAP